MKLCFNKTNVHKSFVEGLPHSRGKTPIGQSDTKPASRTFLIACIINLLFLVSLVFSISLYAEPLPRMAGNDKVNIRFEYDALGRRTAKINEYGLPKYHTITRFLWDGNVPLHEWSYPALQRPDTIDDSEGRRTYVTPEPQTELTTWVFDEGTFVPSAKLVGERRYSILADHLGTPVEAYDEAGKRVWQRELDIYGRIRIEKGEEGFVPFRFQGQYEDEETGLYYNRFRYYSPQSGLYISQDPIRLAGNNPTLYAYTHDSNSWIDPLGLNCKVVKTRSRKDAIQKAKDHAKVPRQSKGGKPIGINELNESSRGKRWRVMKSNNVENLGAKNPRGKNQWMEHPDGHPDAGKEGVPKHHGAGHIHSINQTGEEVIFIWE